MYGNKRIRGSDSRSDSSSRNIPYEMTNILLDHVRLPPLPSFSGSSFFARLYFRLIFFWFILSDTSSGSSSDSLSDLSSVHSSGCDASSQSHPGPSTRVASPRLVYPPVPYSLVPSSTPVSRSITLSLADLPPRKRFRDSYLSEASGEEHMEIGTADAKTVADLGISDGVGAHTKDGIGIGVEVATSDIRQDEEEFEAEASAGGMMEIVVDLLVTGGIYEPTRGDAPDLEGTLYDIAHYMFERSSLADRVRSLGRENLRVRALFCIERDRVDSLCRYMALSQEEIRQICRDRDDTRRRLKRTITNTRSRMTPAAIEEMINRRVTEALETHKGYRDIGLGNGNDEGGNGNYNGNENRGGNGNENHNENDRDARPNSHKRTIGTDAAFAMSWKELMKLMAEIVPKEEDQVEKFIGGLPDNIHGNVIAAEPTRLQDVVCMANNLIDQNKSLTAGNNERRVYNGPLPLYNKCKFHHEGPCTVRCGKCNKVGHLTRDCKAIISTTSNQRSQVVNQRVLTCFECGKQGHYRSDCPKLKDQNRGNKTRNKSGIGEARGKAYVLGGGDANPDSNVVM
ncbi:reverse transcriptase domain-containing protein, partial [Tanacetum coccineum]